MRYCDIAACVMAVALVASPLAHSAAGGGAAASAEVGWTSGYDLSSGVDASGLLVVGSWTSGYDLPSGGDASARIVVGGWTSGYDLPSGSDKILSVAVR